MVKLNRIYTRTGDAGEAALADGARLPKHHPRFAAIGDVDETGSVIGAARLHTGRDLPEVDDDLAAIQNDLFDLGAGLAVPAAGAGGVAGARVTWLEARIDALNASLSPLRSFVLPGGAPAAAHLHVARAVCRRAERSVSALAAEPGEAVSPTALAYMNRLSDYLFVAARFANAQAGGDVLWEPGAARGKKE